MKLSEKTKRKLKYGTSSIIVIAVVAVIAILANILLGQLPMSADITAESLYSVTDTTKDYLGTLDKDVTIYALFDRAKASANSSTADVIKYLDIYDSYSHVDVEYVDLDRNPSFLLETVGEQQVMEYVAGDYIVKCGKNIKHIVSSDMYETETNINYQTYSYETTTKGINCEACLTGAIMYVMSDSIPVVYLSTGCGESGLEAYSKLKLNIQNNNFDIKDINLNKEDIPDDAAVIMFVSPTTDLSTSALGKLKTWFIKTNGNVVALMDYSKAGTDLTNFNSLFELFSLRINNDVIRESDDHAVTGKPQWFSAYTLSPEGSPLEGLSQAGAYFFDTRSIEVLSTTNSYSTPAALVKTSADATSVDIKTGEEKVGEKTIVASGQYQAGTEISKIYLTGSSLNLQDEYIENTSNGNAGSILIRTLKWMHENKNDGDMIPAKEFNTEVISVTQTQATVLFWIGVVIIPVIFLVFGLVIWIKRRHL